MIPKSLKEKIARKSTVKPPPRQTKAVLKNLLDIVVVLTSDSLHLYEGRCYTQQHNTMNVVMLTQVLTVKLYDKVGTKNLISIEEKQSTTYLYHETKLFRQNFRINVIFLRIIHEKT